VPELGQYWADAGSICPVPALFWHVDREVNDIPALLIFKSGHQQV